MKIILVDKRTQEVIQCFNHPQEVIIKPKRRIVKVIEGLEITEYRYYSHAMSMRQDYVLDLVEYILTIQIDAMHKVKYTANNESEFI